MMDPEEAQALATRACTAAVGAMHPLFLSGVRAQFALFVLVEDERGKGQTVIAMRADLSDQCKERWLQEVIRAATEELNGLTVGKRVR